MGETLQCGTLPWCFRRTSSTFCQPSRVDNIKSNHSRVEGMMSQGKRGLCGPQVTGGGELRRCSLAGGPVSLSFTAGLSAILDLNMYHKSIPALNG